MVLLAAAAAGLAGLSALQPSPGAAGENFYVYWLSGVMENDTACVGPQGLHPNDAYDLIVDAGCQGSSSSEVRMRTYGTSPTLHVALKCYMSSGEYDYGKCDYIEARCYEQPSNTYRGTYRYIHAQGVNDAWRDIWAGPGYVPTDNDIDGETKEDSNCTGGWTAYHTHQDAQGAPSQPNDLDPLEVIDVWNVDNYIHKWTFPELDVKYALLFGPAPVAISHSQGRYMWVLARIDNPTSVGQEAQISLSVTAVPGGCYQIQQLILPGEETFFMNAGQSTWALYRERYECHAPASAGSYPLEVRFCVREAHHDFDYDCEEHTRALIIY
jgi:hypothetical protein